MNKIRYMLIDAYNESVSEVYLDRGLQPIYDLIGCDLVESVYLDGTNDIFVDEEGLLKLSADSKFFTLSDLPMSGPFAGSAVITAHNDEGETINTNLSVELIANKVKFHNITEVREMAKNNMMI